MQASEFPCPYLGSWIILSFINAAFVLTSFVGIILIIIIKLTPLRGLGHLL